MVASAQSNEEVNPALLTAKFEEGEGALDGEKSFGRDKYQSSNEKAQKELHDKMIEQSPLKSGPSTVIGSQNMSPSPDRGFTSSQKKVHIPMLNLEKVFEQHKKILEAEERKKQEDEEKLK